MKEERSWLLVHSTGSGGEACCLQLAWTSVDMKEERNWLLRDGVRRLQHLAQDSGIMVQIVDLFWGVSEEVELDPQLYDVHLEQINLSRQYSAGPFFAVFTYLFIYLLRP